MTITPNRGAVRVMGPVVVMMMGPVVVIGPVG